MNLECDAAWNLLLSNEARKVLNLLNQTTKSDIQLMTGSVYVTFVTFYYVNLNDLHERNSINYN